ncbi:site-specific integrase, partial [Patescibacteria group bacterium]|nr:site-specific integrase [Patescibacteria group bacterium]
MEIKIIIKSFRLWLHSRHYSNSTVLNYISDTKKYLHWLQKQPQPNQSHHHPCKFFSLNLVIAYISKISNKKSNTRYLASLSLFCQFALDQNIVSTNPYKKAIKSIKQDKPNNISSLLNHYKTYLITTKKSPVTIRNYLADIRQFISHSNTNSPKTLFDSTQTDNYFKHLKNSQLSPSSTRRKLSSISSFQKFLIKKKYLETPVIASPPIKSGDVATCPEPNRRIPSKSKPSHFSFPFTQLFNKYLLVTSILIIISSLIYGLYYQTILKSKQQLAYSTIASPATPTRQLSFQGRLTDNSDNPITSPLGIQFKLFNSGTGGTELYNSGTGGTAAPDTNGIFSVIIGKNIGDTIPASVFSENTEVWLEIIMDPSGTPEIMDPRQQIATVAYAMNAETLQGIPPSASGLKDTVMVIDGSGNINLGETSPSIISNSSGTFGLEGQAMLIKTTDGSGGNITINPDASGIIQFLTEGTTPSIGGFINATNANLVSGNLFNGQINNTNRGYNFLEFQNYDIGTTSLSSRFSVDAYGNTNIGATLSTINISIGNTLVTSTANELNLLDGTTATNGSLIYGNGSNLTNLNIGASAYVLQSTGSLPIWVPADSAGIGSTITAGSGLTKLGSQIKLGGALTENTRLNIGSTEAFFIDYSTGNIGIGTTGPDTKLQIVTANSGGDAIKIGDGTKYGRIRFDGAGGVAGVINRGTSTDSIYFGENGDTGNYYIRGIGDLYIGNQASPYLFGDGSTGNIGIGTTSPLTKLHIEGQCVTGDSKLITQNGQTLQIKDVKGGEKILSLDETTGKIIPSTINGLLDMGVKPVYKLTTQDGKTIRTTGNHPYLAKTLLPTSPNQNSCDSNKNQSYNSQINISASGHISSPLPQKEKPNNNQYNATDHSSKKVGINNVPFNHFLIPLASNMETAENAKANINDTPKVKKNLDKFSGLTNKGETTPAENQATETLPNISEALSSWPIDNLPILFKNITNKLNNAQWTKIIYLSPGDEIAVADEKDLKFVKIASIEYIGEEQVYDIEVEGTHNFVANGIIAHNTYISDKLGIGATNASYQLNVSGSG